MKNFLKNNGHWIRICLVLAAIIFAAGKITTTQAELCRKIDIKLDKELYDRELTQIRKQLNRIEDKVDDIIRRKYKAGP